MEDETIFRRRGYSSWLPTAGEAISDALYEFYYGQDYYDFGHGWFMTGGTGLLAYDEVQKKWGANLLYFRSLAYVDTSTVGDDSSMISACLRLELDEQYYGEDTRIVVEASDVPPAAWHAREVFAYSGHFAGENNTSNAQWTGYDLELLIDLNPELINTEGKTYFLFKASNDCEDIIPRDVGYVDQVNDFYASLYIGTRQLDLAISLPETHDSRVLLENEEESVGSFVFVNNDNDDADVDFDMDDNSNANENDLTKLRLTSTGKVELSMTEGAEKVHVWEKQSKEVSVTLPKVYEASDLPKELWIEGIKGSDLQRDVEFTLKPVGWEAERDLVTLTVLEVEKVEFRGYGNADDYGDVLQPDRNAPAGLTALEVFPEAQEPGGRVYDSVLVLVALNNFAPYDLDIFLKSFDVDDPSADGGPIDPNDAGTPGTHYYTTDYKTYVLAHMYLRDTLISYDEFEDNRGSVNGKKSGELQDEPGSSIEDAFQIAKLTIEKGHAAGVVLFQVTSQPGDNFRVVASHDKDFLKQLRNRDQTDDTRIFDSTNNKPILDSDKRVSVVLTVWRRLHMEIDRMDKPTLSFRLFELTWSYVFNLEEDDDVNPTEDSASPLSHLVFDFDGRLNVPNTALLYSEFPRAYVLVSNDLWTRNKHYGVEFSRSIDGSAHAQAICNSARDVQSSRSFWVVHMLSAYEGEEDSDNDPNSEEATKGITLFHRNPDGTIDPLRNYSIVYLETIRDLAAESRESRINYEKKVVLHEIGHQFELCDNPGSVSVMTQCSPDKNSAMLSFVPEQLSAIRSINYP